MADRYDEQLLLGYVEGDLSPDEAAEFEKLLEQDPRLRTLAAQLRGDRAGLRRVVPDGAPPEIMESVQARLERGMLLESRPEVIGKAAAPAHLRWTPYLAYAGVAAMIAVAAGLMLRTLMDSDVLKQASGPKVARESSSKTTEPLVENPAKLDLADRLRLADAKQKRDNVTLQESPSVTSNAAALPKDAATSAREIGKVEALSVGKDMAARRPPADQSVAAVATDEARRTESPKVASAPSAPTTTATELAAAPAAGLAPNPPAPPAAGKESESTSASSSPDAKDPAIARSAPAPESPVGRRVGMATPGAAESRSSDLPQITQSQVMGGALNTQGQLEFARMDIKIITADLNKTMQELEPWFEQQQVQVLELDQAPAEGAAENDSVRALGAEKRIVLLLRASQVARLEVHLSGLPNQITRLAAPHAQAPERQAGQAGLRAVAKKSTQGPSHQAIDDGDHPTAQARPAPPTGSRGDPLVLQPVVIEEIKP